MTNNASFFQTYIQHLTSRYEKYTICSLRFSANFQFIDKELPESSHMLFSDLKWLLRL